MLIPDNKVFWHSSAMRDWSIKYMMDVLEKKDWSPNRLANQSGLATSTIARPLREKDYPHKLSRSTISKIWRASGIDPSPYIPKGLHEDAAIFSQQSPQTTAARVLSDLDNNLPDGRTQKRNEIKHAVVGDVAQIVATVDLEGIQKLRRLLDKIESILKDD